MNGLAPDKTTERIHIERSIRTVAKRKREWMDNVRLNAANIKNDLSKLWLDDNYGEIVSVAAGPSLQHDLDSLRNLLPGRELVCVDAAFKYLLDNRIVPDYVICTDASEKILPMLDGVGSLPTKLILNVVAHPSIVKAWPGEIYWYVMMNQFFDLDNHEMIQSMHSYTSKVGTKIVPGGNVSSIALGFALSIRNAEKVYLFGHDFCWKEEMYCGGYMKDLALQRMEEEKRAGTVFEMLNTRGEKVLTNLSLRQFSLWHEEVITSMKNRVVNCTSSTILNMDHQEE